MFVTLIDVEVQLVSPSEYPITMFTLVFVSPREVNGLREGKTSFNLLKDADGKFSQI